MSEAQVKRKPRSKQVISRRPISVEGNTSSAQSITRSSSARLGAFYAAGPVLSLGMPVQGRLVQRQATEEEETSAELPIQTMLIQRQAAEEEPAEEPVQPQWLQRQSPEEEGLLQGKFTTHETPAQLQGDVGEADNRNGMPRPLKAGLEALSGVDLSGIRVHYNASKPAQLNALAYTQGKDIHIGPGQEKHLPHEGWHAVQQMQERVHPTTQTKGVSINEDAGLEREADVMGVKALQIMHTSTTQRQGHRQGAMSLQREVETKAEAEVSGEAIGTSGETGLSELQRGPVQRQDPQVQRKKYKVEGGETSVPPLTNLIKHASFSVDRSSVRMSVSYRELVNNTIRNKMKSGFKVTLLLNASLHRDQDGHRIATAQRICHVVYDLWKEKYKIQVVENGGSRDEDADSLNNAIKKCVTARNLLFLLPSRLSAGHRYHVRAQAAEQLYSAKEYKDLVRRTIKDIKPENIYSRMVRWFIKRLIKSASAHFGRVIKFRTQSFEAPR